MPIVLSAGQTIYKKFTTRDANVPATLSGSPVVKVYKDDATSTEENTGVTLSVDFDGITGFNHITIDTSADATFYANGHHYAVTITTGTVGGSSVVGETIWEFDLVAATAAAPTAAAIATAIFTDLLASSDFSTSSSFGKLIKDNLDAVVSAIKAKTDLIPASPASTTNITAGTITTTTNLTNLPAAPTDWLSSASVSAAAVSKIQSGLSTYAGGDTAGTTTLLARLTSTRAGLLDNLDAAVSTRSTYAGGAVASVTGNVGGNVTGTVGGLTTAGLAGFFITNTTKVFADAISGSVVKEIVSNVSGGGGGGGATAAEVWDEVLTAATHNIDNSAGKLLRLLIPSSDAIYSGTAPSQSGMTLLQIKLDSGASSTADVYNFDIVSITGGTGAGQSRLITDYTGGTKIASIDSVWDVQPDNTSTFDITATPYASGINELLARLTLQRAANLDNLDALVSSRSTYAGGDTSGVTALLARLTAPRAALLDNLANLDAAVSTRSTYAGGDTSGVTTLLSRITGTIATSGGGVKLMPTGLDDVDDAELTGAPANFREQQQWVYQRLAGNVTKTLSGGSGSILVKSSGFATATTQAITDDGSGGQTQGRIS